MPRPDTRRSVTYKLRMRPRERRSMQEAADREGIPMSEFCRRAILRAAREADRGAR